MICCGDMKVLFILLTCLTVLSTCELVGDSTVDGKGNKEEEENFFQQGCDMLW